MNLLEWGYDGKKPRQMLIPCAITILGAALSLAWIARLVPWWTGALGLLCDCIDGPMARTLGVDSDFGSLLDWTVDMLLWSAAISRALPPEYAIFAIIGALPLQVGLRLSRVHFCGRAAVFAVLLASEVLG